MANTLDAELFDGTFPKQGDSLWLEILGGLWDRNFLLGARRSQNNSAAYHQYFATELDAWRCVHARSSIRAVY
jgi:hypothetical protein